MISTYFNLKKNLSNWGLEVSNQKTAGKEHASGCD